MFRKSAWLVGLTLVTLVSCNKDKLATKPSLKLKSFGPALVSNGGSLKIDLEFADLEGDISDTIYVEKIRINKQSTPTVRNILELAIPAVPNPTRGNIILTLGFQVHLVSAINPPVISLNPLVVENDSLILKMSLRDQAGNYSDTLTSPLIVVDRN